MLGLYSCTYLCHTEVRICQGLSRTGRSSLEMPQSKHKCRFHPGHPCTVVWKGGDYVWIQTSLYPRKETIYLSIFCDSDRLSGRTPALLKKVFQSKNCPYAFSLLPYILPLHFLCENSELGHYSALCKLKAWEWATQPCLCAVCWNPRNL